MHSKLFVLSVKETNILTVFNYLVVSHVPNSIKIVKIRDFLSKVKIVLNVRNNIVDVYQA